MLTPVQLEQRRKLIKRVHRKHKNVSRYFKVKKQWLEATYWVDLTTPVELDEVFANGRVRTSYSDAGEPSFIPDEQGTWASEEDPEFRTKWLASAAIEFEVTVQQVKEEMERKAHEAQQAALRDFMERRDYLLQLCETRELEIKKQRKLEEAEHEAEKLHRQAERRERSLKNKQLRKEIKALAKEWGVSLEKAEAIYRGMLAQKVCEGLDIHLDVWF